MFPWQVYLITPQQQNETRMNGELDARGQHGSSREAWELPVAAVTAGHKQRGLQQQSPESRC